MTSAPMDMDNHLESANGHSLQVVLPPRSAQQRAPREARTIRRILVCIDRSPLSEACLQHAIAISNSLGSAITLLNVVQPPAERPGQSMDLLDWEVSRQEASAYMERLEREGTRASGQHIETRLEQGHPSERITAVAHEIGADLTVLGTHGGRGAAAWNLGSTVMQVLAVTRASVLIARPSLAAAGEVSPKRILVPLDGSARTESVLPTAVRIARKYGAELLLVMVVRDLVPTAVLHAQADVDVARDLARRLETSGKAYLEVLRGQLVREGASARTMVLRSADEKQSLLDFSHKEGSDLVILSAHGATCNPAVTFGSVTAHHLAHSVIPLLVLQDLRDADFRDQEKDERAPPLRASFPRSRDV
jgi:nucleotide-binding universal stress UspA family protein